jgi:L-iditol 2-dehydrogenase
MKTMKVAVYYNNNDVRIEEMPIPKINDDELLVKVQASGICGSDVMEWYRLKTAPRVLGHEIAGDIVEVGKNVKKYKIGDRVFISHHVPCNNCNFCNNNKVPEINVDNGTFVLPKEMTYEEGAFIEPLACVVRGFRIAEMKPEQSILILGSGIAGLLQIKLAKAMGARKIFATDINEHRLKIAKKLGADITINAEENVAKLVKKNNDGMLTDFVILCAGVPSAVKQAFESVTPGGTILFFAMTKPGVEIPFHLFDIWNKQVKIVSTYAGAPKDIVEAIEFIKSKKVEVTDMISHRLPLSEAAKGFQLVAKAQDSIKVILEP